jgi:hypothetical protein
LILESIRSAWELPAGQGLWVAALVLLAGAAAWLAVVGALRRFGPTAPWWAVDLSGACAGLAAGFVVVVLQVVPGPAVDGELVLRDGELRLATVHEQDGVRRLRVRALPEGGVRAAWALGDRALAEVDPWTGRLLEEDVPTRRCPLTPVTSDGAGALRCGDLAEHGIGRLVVRDGELVAEQAGQEHWARPLGSLLGGAPLVGVAVLDGALVVVGSTPRGVVAAGLDAESGRARWRSPGP